MNLFLRKTRGSIALISILIISAFTLIVAVLTAETNISTGYQYVNRFSENDSYYSAEGCLEEALIRIEGDSSFATETVTFTGGSCVINVTGTDPKTVDITFTQGSNVQNFRGEVDITLNGHAINTSLSTWSEI